MEIKGRNEFNLLTLWGYLINEIHTVLGAHLLTIDIVCRTCIGELIKIAKWKLQLFGMQLYYHACS